MRNEQTSGKKKMAADNKSTAIPLTERERSS